MCICLLCRMLYMNANNLRKAIVYHSWGVAYISQLLTITILSHLHIKADVIHARRVQVNYAVCVYTCMVLL